MGPLPTGKYERLVPFAFFTCRVGDQREPAGIAVDIEGSDVSTNGGGIPRHIAFAVAVYRGVRDR